MARQDILDQSRKPLISQMNPGMGSWVDKRDKQLERIKRQQQQILDSADWDVEATYITKDPTTRDKYDIAFWSLNPGSVSKAKKYHNLEQKRLEIENEKVNLEWARDFMNQVYANQRWNINSQYNNLNRTSWLKNDIALSNALATAWGAGGNVVQNSALKAQAANNLAAQLLESQAQRDAALAQVDAQEANIPVTLSNLWAQNASIDATRAQEELAKAQADYYRNQGRTSWWSYWWGSSSATKTKNQSDRALWDDWLWHYKWLARWFTAEQVWTLWDNYKSIDEFNKWLDYLGQWKITVDEFVAHKLNDNSNSEAPWEEKKNWRSAWDIAWDVAWNTLKNIWETTAMSTVWLAPYLGYKAYKALNSF